MSEKKIDLHCHLDGSVSLHFLKEAMKRQGQSISLQELKDRVQVKEECTSLAEYLACFSLTIACLQTKENLKLGAKEMARDAAAEGVCYMETRFAPASFMEQGLEINEILESVKEGLREAEEETGILVRMILCTMRHHDKEQNLRVIHAAREWLGNGVVACDLAGDEEAFPTSLFREVFSEARRLGVPFTLHAGECGNPQSIREAIEMGAARIGHGTAMKGNEELKSICREKRIGVEMCPTSNFQTGAATSWETYPFPEFLREDIPVCVNTDNRLMSCTNLTKELEKVCTHFSLTQEDMEKIYRNSVEISFAEDEIKDRLLKKAFLSH